MPQYFIKSNEIEDNIYYIKGDDFHHLVNVRRINNSDSVILRDENGTAFVSEDCFAFAKGLKILGQPDGEKKLYQVLRNFDESEIVSLFVGPEGGFSDREIEVAKKNGCEIVVFGENHLRAETAAIVLPALIQYERGLM